MRVEFTYVSHTEGFLEASKQVVDEDAAIILDTEQILLAGPVEADHTTTVPLIT